MAGKLYLCATPIGNLEDMTYRVVRTLGEVDLIAAEDTRNSIKLLNHFEIKNKLIALHDHNEDVVKDKVLEYLKDGKNVAIVTDRGSPIISDPGYKTVKFLKDNGYNVIVGPNVEKAELLYLSNTPAEIGKEFMEMYANPNISLLLSVGGGEMQFETLPYFTQTSISVIGFSKSSLSKISFSIEGSVFPFCQ